MQTEADSKTRKKRKFEKRYWLLIDLAAASIILALLLCRPSRYNPPGEATDDGKQGKVCPYLTHELLPQLYNGIQQEEPFELVVTQKGINEIIAWSKWPKESEGVRFSSPEVLFVPDGIVLMGTAVIGGVELVITIVAEPALDEDGLLNLRVAKIKIGALNVTPIARMVAKRMYAQRLETTYIDTEDLRAKIAASLLNNEAFEPVFEIEDKKVRVKKIIITEGKLTARLAPASD